MSRSTQIGPPRSLAQVRQSNHPDTLLIRFASGEPFGHSVRVNRQRNQTETAQRGTVNADASLIAPRFPYLSCRLRRFRIAYLKHRSYLEIPTRLLPTAYQNHSLSGCCWLSSLQPITSSSANTAVSATTSATVCPV